jgi:biopolymer transport protein ExbD
VNIRRRAQERSIELNITALTDVVLLIIIFFMFSTHFAKTQQREMDLPKEPGFTAADAPSSVIVEIDAQGKMNVVGVGAASIEEVVKYVQGASKFAGKGPMDDVELVLRADRNAPAKYLNDLAGALAKAGMRTWKLATAGGGA